MSFLSRIKQWVLRRLGRHEQSDTTGLKCSICGTTVPEDGDRCPLCGSTDFIPVNNPGTTPARSLSQERATHHTEPSSDDSVAQLQRVRTDQILSNNTDSWDETDEGYEVLVEDETIVVDSKQEAARLLEETE